MSNEEFIAIPHFINPQLFWYHKVDGQNQLNQSIELQRIEDSLESLFTKKQSASQGLYHPHVGEIVAIVFVSWNKYIRARVEDIVKYITEDELIVWALDYGFPFQTKLTYIRKLPDTYKRPTDHIRLGAIANVIPAEEELDLVTITSRLVCKQSWSKNAVEWLEKLVNDAASISFIESFALDQVSQKHHFGDLKIISHSGEEFLVSDQLVKLKYAVKCVDNFCIKLNKLKTTKLPCWQNNNRGIKLIENKLNTINAHYAHQQKFNLSDSLSISPCDTFSKQKVIDWCERNRTCNNNNDTYTDGLCPMSALDATDFSFDDSVSVNACQAPHTASSHDESVMGYAGALHETRRKMYEGKSLPPMPNLDVFNIFSTKDDDLSKPVDSSSSRESQRAKALVELRKKYQAPAKDKKDEIILQEKISKLNLSSPSEVGTEEFLEACKKNNAHRAHLEKLRIMRKRRLKDVHPNNMDQPVEDIKSNKDDANSNDSSSSIKNLGNACSNVSRMSSILKKIKEKHSKMDAKALENRESPTDIQIFENNTDEQSQTASKISAHAEKLIRMRKKIKEKYSKQSELESCTINNDNDVENCATVHSHQRSYRMPQQSTKLTKLNCSYVSQRHSEIPAVQLDELSPSIVMDPGSQSDSNSKPTTAHENEIRNIRKIMQSNPFQNMTMVPAGYDLANLVERKDEDNHWHTKKTTLDDSLHSNYSSDGLQSNNCSSKQSIPRRTEDIDWQNFRHTRSRKERKKKISEKSDEKHLLDMSLKDDDCAQALKPVLIAAENLNKTQGLLVFDTEKKDNGKIVTNTHLEKLNNSDKLIDLSTSGEVFDESASTDSFLMFVKDKSSVKENSSEQLLETSNVTSDRTSDLFSINASVEHLIEKKVNNIDVESSCQDSSPSISSSSSSKLASTTQNIGFKKMSEDAYHSYEESSSACSSSMGKIKIVDPDSASMSPILKNLSSRSSGSSLPKSESLVSLNLKPNLDKQVSYAATAIPADINKTLSSSLGSLAKSTRTISSSSILTLKKCPDHLPEVAGEASLSTNLIKHLVLAHCNIKVTPTERISTALFSPEVHQEMENMRMTKMYRIQSYAWAHLIRGNSFFVINASRTGKTWCYLPPLCSMVSFRLETKCLPQTSGPVAVVIAPSSIQVESIARQCRRLLNSTKTRVTIVPTYAFRNAGEVKIELHNGCGILIVTPPSLQRLLVANEREALLNMERIQCLIVDGLDIMMSQNDDFDEILHKFIGPVIQHQENGKIPFQMVITSKRWSRRMINFLKISNQPLLCIADYLEAAVYAKAKILIKLQSSTDKMKVILKYLEKCPYALERVVVICNSDQEVDDLSKCLLEAGFACIAYTERMSVELSNLINEWKVKTICHQILVTTDCVLPELMIQNAWTVIHYSLPTSWTKFNFRFSAFLQNYENLLTTNFEKPSKVPKALILLDEENNLQLPRLIEFMKHHNQLKHIHPDILNVAARVVADREESRVAQGILLCPQILEFGSCDENSRCPYRHQLTKYDGPVEEIPTHGEVRVKILDVFSPTHYTARLLTQKKGTSWEIVKRSNEVTHFLMQFTLHFMNDDAQIIHWPLRVNDLCVYKGEGVFHRCRLIEVPSIVHENIVKIVNVKVKLIDSGPSLMCKSNDILVIPEKFKDFPAQAVDLRLSGVVPYDNERVWDSRSTRTVKSWLMTDITDKDFVQASINFSLIDTIWVSNVILIEKLAAICGYSVKINVRRSLLGKEFALPDNRMHSIKRTAIENGLLQLPSEVNRQEENVGNHKEEESFIEFSTTISSDENDIAQQVTNPELVKVSLPNIEKKLSLPKVVPNEATDEWMQLQLDELLQVKITQLHDPSRFYLRLMHTEDDLNELDDMIRNHKHIPLEDPHPMQDCLGLHDGRYHRAKIQRLIVDSNEKYVHARLFFCDLGIFLNCPLEKLRSSSKLLTGYIPFQAICCKLTGVRVECVGEQIQNAIQTEDRVHYAYAVNEISDADDADEEIHIRKYDIILHECFKDNIIQINKLLVELELATYDDDTKHFLELETKVDFAGFDYERDEFNKSYDFQEFLNRIKEQMDEEDAEEEKMNTSTYKAIENIEDDKAKTVETTQDSDSYQAEKKIKTIPPKTDCKMPVLKTLYKRPLTTWYETMCMIYLVIHAPDISDYHLEVTPKQLIFVAFINGQQEMLILNLLGYVEPDQVTHEVRGLNVVVRLVKSVYMKWPRLLEYPAKLSWLTYNFNTIDTTEAEKLIDGRRLRKKSSFQNCMSDADDASDTSDVNPCETFTPILNLDDLHDPTQELY